MKSRMLVAALLGVSVAAPRAVVQDPTETENHVKAAFVYQFTRYVEWPRGVLADGAPFMVCVVAQNMMRHAIEQALDGERVEGRPIRLTSPTTPEAARACHLLYIESRSMAQGEPLLGAVHKLPVLTISDSSEFAPNGGHIQLFREGTRVRFNLNQTSAKDCGLTLRSQLLRIAAKILIPAANIP